MGGTKASWLAAHHQLMLAFAAVGASGEMVELRFEWGGTEFVMFGRPAQVRVSTDNLSVGKSIEQCAFIAADPRIYASDLTSQSAGLPVQRGGLTIPARVATTRLRLPGVSGAYSSTPNHSSLQITGDLDLRFEGDISWSGSQRGLVNRGFFSATDRSYLLTVEAGGELRLWWSSTGTATTGNPVSTVPLPFTSGRYAVRATLDVDNGASGRTIVFYTGPSLNGPWTQLGASVVQAGVTSVFAGASALEVGSWGTGVSGLLSGAVYGAQVRSGIGGTVVAGPDFTAQSVKATSFADSTAKTWTVHGDARLVAGTFRGGLTLPTVIPGRLAGGALSFMNSGTTAAPLILRIDGPVVEPWVLVRRPDGVTQSVRFDLTLAEGQWITVDSISRQALLNDDPASNQRGRATWDMDAYPLLPGVSTVRFGGGEYNTDAQLTMSARSAWL
jgi:hypothetical protein